MTVGCFNFTKAAEENNENLLVLRDKRLAEDIGRIGRSTPDIQRLMGRELSRRFTRGREGVE